MVVVDRFTKIAHFIPCSTTITSQQTIDLFISHIFSLHGLPSEIVSDRGPQFISQVQEGILSALKIKPCRSTSFHPQSDGQTERVNQILEQYLCCYASASQDSWLTDLPLAEFTYNILITPPLVLPHFSSIMVTIHNLLYLLNGVQIT